MSRGARPIRGLASPLVCLVAASAWLGAAPGGVAAGQLAPVVRVLSDHVATAAADDRDGDGLSDDFEERWGISSPMLADSDGDGLIDAAEDVDGDGLSALGEQRFGTDPTLPDSDADGVPDGDEDSDGDGRTDAQQQDERPVPRDLQPTTQMAWWDRPDNYDDECHNDALDPQLHPCSSGVQDADISVVLFGDSHALQWLPALVGAGEAAGWRITALTKAACPPAQVEFGRKEVGAAASCRAWRQRALDWLADEPPDVVLLTGAGRRYRLLGQDGRRLSDEAGLLAWQSGLAATLRSLPGSTATVVLADTPVMRRNPVSCLEANPGDISACVTPRSAAMGSVLDDAERITAQAFGAAFETLDDLVCPYDPCPVVIGDTLMWRNADHITATFARELAPSMRELVSRHLVGRDQPASDEADAAGQAEDPSGGGEGPVGEEAG